MIEELYSYLSDRMCTSDAKESIDIVVVFPLYVILTGCGRYTIKTKYFRISLATVGTDTAHACL